MSRIRVCHIITELAPAGAERCVYELATRLNRDAFDVRVVGLRGGAVADWLREAGVPVDVLGVRGKWDVLKLRTLTSLLKAWNVEFLHTHLFHAALAGGWAAARTSVPHWVHTIHTAEQRFRPWQFALEHWMAARCEMRIAVSESVREHHARLAHLRPERYTVIPNGVDASAYRRDAGKRAKLRGQWGVAEGEVLAACVGRLHYEKGTDLLLEAYRVGGEALPKLVLAGEGPMRGRVEKFIAGEPAGKRLRLLGRVDDVAGVLSAADLLVMPSRWEGFGLAAAEAMAAELPVVGFAVSGLREVVVAGQTGLLVPPENPAALAEGIKTLAGDADLRRRLGRAGRDRVENQFPLEANLLAHEALYRKIVLAR